MCVGKRGGGESRSNGGTRRLTQREAPHGEGSGAVARAKGFYTTGGATAKSSSHSEHYRFHCLPRCAASSMTLPLRTLPIVEQWDCNGCCHCCRATVIRLNDDDLRRLRQQRWEHNPDYRGQKIVIRRGLWRRRHFLAKRKDGTCVFLTADGRCRIHRDFGMAAKPFVCQMFPFQLVPLAEFAYLTSRRLCPSAAADRGRKLADHLDDARRMAEEGGLAAAPGEPPPVARRQPASWQRTLPVADCIERINARRTLSAGSTAGARAGLLRSRGTVPPRQSHGRAACTAFLDVGNLGDPRGGGADSSSGGSRPARPAGCSGRPPCSTFGCTRSF